MKNFIYNFLLNFKISDTLFFIINNLKKKYIKFFKNKKYLYKYF